MFENITRIRNAGDWAPTPAKINHHWPPSSGNSNPWKTENNRGETHDYPVCCLKERIQAMTQEVELSWSCGRRPEQRGWRGESDRYAEQTSRKEKAVQMEPLLYASFKYPVADKSMRAGDEAAWDQGRIHSRGVKRSVWGSHGPGNNSPPFSQTGTIHNLARQQVQDAQWVSPQSWGIFATTPRIVPVLSNKP